MLPATNSGFLLLANGERVPFQLRRSSRRRTLGLTVTRDAVRIHAPSYTPRAEIARYVSAQHDWLARAWMRMRARAAAAVGGEAGVGYLGRRLVVEMRPAVHVRVWREGARLVIAAPAGADARELVRAWLHRQAARLLAWRLRRLAARLGRAPARFALSDAQTRWGSCTRRGHIRLNWRLVQAPLPLIDYVAAHELAHLVHLDHSPRFWAQVAALCPDPIARRAELRQIADRLFIA
jgi:hypothetical protein